MKNRRLTAIRISSVLAVLFATVYIGVIYVAPRIILRLNRHVTSSTAADYGLRFDDLLVVSEDSLDLKGEHIYPFHINKGDTIPNHSLIVLHPIMTNARSVWPIVKPFITMDINFVTFDFRGHGRSDGHLYTLGIRESKDVSSFIDMIREIYPDHSFGIYARGNSSHIALKAMSDDPRIQYGIIENFHKNLTDHLEYLNYDDVLYDAEFIQNHIIDGSLDLLDAKAEDAEINICDITQPTLLLSTTYNYPQMLDLHSTLCIQEKYLVLFNENIYLKPSVNNRDEGLYNCIEEFIELYSEEAKKQVREQVFQPS